MLNGVCVVWSDVDVWSQVKAIGTFLCLETWVSKLLEKNLILTSREVRLFKETY